MGARRRPLSAPSRFGRLIGRTGATRAGPGARDSAHGRHLLPEALGRRHALGLSVALRSQREVAAFIDALPADYPPRLRWVLLSSADPLFRAAASCPRADHCPRQTPRKVHLTACSIPSCHITNRRWSTASRRSRLSGLPWPWPASRSTQSSTGCSAGSDGRGGLQRGGHLARVQRVHARVVLAGREEHRRILRARPSRSGTASRRDRNANWPAFSAEPYSGTQ